MKKYLGIVCSLVLVLSLSLIPAVPAGANPGGIELVTEGDATAEWSTEKAYTGDYSVELTAGTIDWMDWAGVQIPVGELLSDMSAIHADYSFQYVTDGTPSQTPAVAFVFEVAGETWKLVEYFTALETTETVWTSDVLKPELFLMSGSTSDGSAKYWGTSGWRDDMGGDFVYQDLSSWQLADVMGSALGSRTVDKLGVSIGALAGTVYVDDVTIDNVTYDLEASGALGMTATFEPTIGISVNPTFVDFGAVSPGAPSGSQVVTVTNEGTSNADFAASIVNESHQGVYTTGLKIDAVAVSAWGEEDVVADAFVEPELILTVPDGTAPGNYNAVLVFWAMAK